MGFFFGAGAARAVGHSVLSMVSVWNFIELQKALMSLTLYGAEGSNRDYRDRG